MYENTKKLISIASFALGEKEIGLSKAIRNSCGKLGLELESLLSQKNGFYAFESALHLFPSGPSEGINIEQWNSKDLWISSYGDLLADNCVFFAEDIFGCQFCIYQDEVHSFDIETGELEFMASSIEEWAAIILEDYNMWTGYSLAHDWQVKHGRIPINTRLMPKVPFVCGGEFITENLSLIDAVSGMKSRANLAVQLINLEDGQQIEFKIIE